LDLGSSQSGAAAYRVADRGEEILAVYAAHVREIYAFCLRRLASVQLAEDATSAVFLRLVQEYETIGDRGKQGIRYWLYGTARNAVAKHIRDAGRHREVVAELTRLKEADQSNGVRGDPLDWPVLYEAIGKLKWEQQDIVVLRYFQNLTTAEIAAVLDMKHVTVRVHLSRAVKRLKQELGAVFDA
jgi:RNA polymerase sigma factor (sigma-70 family)